MQICLFRFNSCWTHGGEAKGYHIKWIRTNWVKDKIKIRTRMGEHDDVTQIMSSGFFRITPHTAPVGYQARSGERRCNPLATIFIITPENLN